MTQIISTLLSLSLVASSVLAAPSSNSNYVINNNTPGFIKKATDKGSANSGDKLRSRSG